MKLVAKLTIIYDLMFTFRALFCLFLAAATGHAVYTLVCKGFAWTQFLLTAAIIFYFISLRLEQALEKERVCEVEKLERIKKNEEISNNTIDV